MATSKGPLANKASMSTSKKHRLLIKTNVMRELMFASGGRCAMTDCGLSLLSPSGGWVGTVAHIVAAEPGGPRGAESMSPEERRGFDNLILMCATHGREVDDPDTGEARFPIEALRRIKERHEAKVGAAVEQAIDEEVSGSRTALGLIDTALRPATTAETARGLAEFLDVEAPAVLVPGLNHVRASLQRLSQVGLDALSQTLRIWTLHCHNPSSDVYDFGDTSSWGPSVPIEKVSNRIAYGSDSEWSSALDELESSGLLVSSIDEYHRSYSFQEPWSLRDGKYRHNFWISAAHFLHLAFGIEIGDWIRTLDFSIFDRPAPNGRPVPWR